MYKETSFRGSDLHEHIFKLECKHGSRAGEPEPGVFGSLETESEPLGKKVRIGAGAAKILAGSSAMREDKKKNQEPEPLGKK